MEVMSGIAADFPHATYSGITRYRHEVFVERLGWELRTQSGVEQDQFDRADTVYLAVRNDEGNICGFARLLPTTRPYLLSEVFPQLFNGLSPPMSPEVWELSRFAAMDLHSRTYPATGQFSSPVAVALLQAAVKCAAARGAKRLVTVSPIGVERLLRRAGFRAHRAGPPMIIDGYPLFACWIEVGVTDGLQTQNFVSPAPL